MGAHRDGHMAAARTTDVPPGTVQRCGDHACPPGTCGHRDDEHAVLRRHPAPHSAPAAGGAAPESVHAVLRGPGQPLEPPVRSGMEGWFGRDLGAVRIHSDGAAARSAADIGALAYTVGNRVAFGERQFRPGTDDGRRLLAHELAHVVQQGGVPPPSGGALRLGAPDDRHEREAHSVAARAAHPTAGDRPDTVRRAPVPGRAAPAGTAGAPAVRVDCGAMLIEFATDNGVEAYSLTSCRMPPGQYTATVQVDGHDLVLDFGEQTGGEAFAFSYRVGPGQRDPSRLFTRNNTVVTVTVNDTAGAARSGPGSGPRPLESVLVPDATYALALAPGYMVSGGTGLARGALMSEALAGDLVAAEAVGTAEALLAAQGLGTAGTVVAEGAGIGATLTAAGEGILFVEAAGAAEVEAAVPVAGWIVGAIVLAVAGGLLVAGYLLSRETRPKTQQQPRQRTDTGRRTSPEPTQDVFPDVGQDTRRRRRPQQCRSAWMPPAGGNVVHDEFARLVALRYGNAMYATVNYWLTDGRVVADFDHHNPDVNEFFEAKTRHEILLRDWARSQPEILARLLEQAGRQHEILTRCAEPGWRLVWFFDDERVADVAREYLGPVVDEVRFMPWNRRVP
ncbi:DUF4157 domain-containing protein [Streptomyces sp. NPDC002888]|uniref:eCIS core domain-containing protein n=1 Tax=Streptomyces sp. NPDC002888 TaxID=3364668 RepID=UPI003678396A